MISEKFHKTETPSVIWLWKVFCKILHFVKNVQIRGVFFGLYFPVTFKSPCSVQTWENTGKKKFCIRRYSYE